jgi:putative heme-binding domain-containing protein
LGGEGRAFGPGLAAARIQGKEATLTAILEPNRDVAADYATCLAETREGESLLGRETAKNDSTLTLLQPMGGPVAWLLADIQSRQTQSWSLMPEGLEQGLTLQQMADLLEYVLAAPDSNSRGNK